MAEVAKLEDAAEKAYAAAAEKVEATPVAAKVAETKVPEPKPVVAPIAAKVGVPAPVANKIAAKPVAEAPAKRKYVRKAPAAAKSAAVKPVAAKAKPVAIKAKVAAKAKPAKINPAKPNASPTTLISKLKETKMATTTKKTADDFTAKIQDTVKDVQTRAKSAFEKSQALFGDAGEFTKGNLEAMVESGKILASGVQAMGKTYVAEVKSTIETVQADAKDLRAAVTSPTEFVKLQSTLMRKYFDNVVAYNSKSAEAALKLANEAFQPISSRVSLAIDKVKKAA